MNAYAYGMSINTLTPDDMLSIPCPTCGATGTCVQVGTPMRVERNDWHAERKYAVLAEKQAKRMVIAEQAKQVEEASNAVEVGQVEENNLPQHQDGDSLGEVQDPGSSDSPVEVSGEEVDGSAVRSGE